MRRESGLKSEAKLGSKSVKMGPTVEVASIKFTDKSIDFAYLGNDYRSLFMVDTIVHKSVTAYLIYRRYQNAERDSAANHMRGQDSPLYARLYYKRNPIPDYLKAVVLEKEKTMLTMAVMMKFISNSDLATKLIETGGLHIEYVNDQDTHLGINRNGVGENALGASLMSVRDVLTKGWMFGCIRPEPKKSIMKPSTQTKEMVSGKVAVAAINNAMLTDSSDDDSDGDSDDDSDE